MKKGTFYKKIRAKKEAKGFTFEKAEGYIDHGSRIAYHKEPGIYEKNKMFWFATDTQSGLLVVSHGYSTRKECMADVEKLDLNKVRKGEKYNAFVKDLQEWLLEQTDVKEEIERKVAEKEAEIAQEGENEMKQKKKGTQRNQGMKMANDEVVRIHATRYHGLSKKNIRRIERKEKMATWERNVEHAGIEITFKEKPEKAVRDMLKSVGFRWHNAKQLWYAKETEARVKVAEMVCA